MWRPVVFAFAGRWMALALLAAVSDAFAPQSFPSADRMLCDSATTPLKQVKRLAYGPKHGNGRRVILDAVVTDEEKEVEKTGDTAENVTVEPLVSPSPIRRRTTSSTWDEIGRALGILSITWNEWLLPVGQELLRLDNNNPSSWDEFWELSLKKNSNSNDMIAAEQFTLYLERLGATYVKFGQALASRPDIIPRSLAVALSKLQDDMEVDVDSYRLATANGAKDTLRREYAKAFRSNKELPPFRDLEEMEEFLSTLSEEPVAAASIGVVYSGILPGGQKVAIKIQRPNVKELIQKDAKLLRRAAELIESIPSVREKGNTASKSDNSNNNNYADDLDRLIQTNVTGAIDEFMTRLEEELDYKREANNLELFGRLYSHRRRPASETGVDELVNLSSNSDIRVVVPQVYKHLCTDKVLVMEWIDGIKLVDLKETKTKDEEETEETMELIRQGIDCTLSQLLETGILHADPHGGNLLKVAPDEGDTSDDNDPSSSPPYRLGYIDFGMLSTIPGTVQDGLICAVCQLIFANNVTAVSELFGELQLLPEEILEDPIESAALAEELTLAIGKVLVFPTGQENSIAEAEGRPKIPTLRFDKLLDVLTRLVPRFRFQLPPYFLNNARALATLEGMAREVDPNFNILRHLYPYAISRIFSNPTNSPVVEGTLLSLIQTPSTGKIDISKVLKLLKDASNFSGYSKLKVIGDIAKSKAGPGLVGRLAKEQTVGRVRRKISWRRKRKTKQQQQTLGSKRKGKRRWVLDKLAQYSRL